MNRRFKLQFKHLLFLFIGSLSFMGCGNGAKTHSYVRDTGQFEKYVLSFENDAKNLGDPITVNDISIKFGELRTDEYGRCTLTEGQTPEILINEKRFTNELNEDRRELLIKHELGHCILKRPHLDILDKKSNRPMSIMYTYLFDSQTYDNNKQEYINELFNRKN